MSLQSILVVAAAVLSVASATHAATFTASSFDNGWYNGASHSPLNTNVITGYLNKSEYRSFYAFDLAAALGQTVTSATMTFTPNNGSYSSRDRTETVGLFDVSTPVASLLGGTAGASGFTDLGTGNSYGSSVYARSQNETMRAFSIVLTGAALTDMTALLKGSTSQFVIGAALQSLSGQRDQFLWGSSFSTPAASLTFEAIPAAVPLPAAFPLLLLAIGGLGLAARRRKAT